MEGGRGAEPGFHGIDVMKSQMEQENKYYDGMVIAIVKLIKWINIMEPAKFCFLYSYKQF